MVHLLFVVTSHRVNNSQLSTFNVSFLKVLTFMIILTSWKTSIWYIFCAIVRCHSIAM